MKIVSIMWVVTLTWLISCSQSQFAGNENGRSTKQTPEPQAAQPQTVPIQSTSTSDTSTPDHVVLPPSTTPPIATNTTNVSASGTPILQTIADALRGTPLAGCADTSRVQTQNVQVSFPANHQSCQWNQNGNLGPSDLQGARFEMTKPIVLPANSQSCAISLESQENHVSFDDFILITFEGLVMASSNHTQQDFTAMGLASQAEGFRFDWMKYRDYSPVGVCAKKGYCAPGADCDLTPGSFDPVSNQCNAHLVATGPVNVRLDQNYFKKLPADIQSKTTFNVGIVVSGNQDATDCRHSGITFNVRYDYIQN